MTTQTSNLTIADAARVLGVDAEALLDEVRRAAAAAERPSALD